jgi:hypothetical protein
VVVSDSDAERAGLPPDVASAVLGRRRTVRGGGGFTFRFRVENAESMSDVLERVDDALETFAPKSRWETDVDADETKLMNAAGEVLNRWYDADVEARYLGPE